MVITKRTLLTEGRDLLLFIAAGTLTTYFTCHSCRESVRNYAVVAALSSCLWIFLWKGNSRISHYLNDRIPWVEFPVRRVVTGLITTISYTALTVIGTLHFFEYFFSLNFGYDPFYFSIIATIIVSPVLHGRAFFLHWRQAKVEAERFEKENILARYESLRNQVNPHFLFNSLNALTNLVYEDQDKAVRFIKQLSEVYRYVLDTRDREVVPIDEELTFLRSYIYLQQIRFGDKLTIELATGGIKSMVAPLSLQMLLENAIKHNVISEENPLSIKIYKEGEYLVIENSLKRRKGVQVQEGAGLGLENIQKRYAFLTDKKVEILEQDDTFKVKLPVIPPLS